MKRLLITLILTLFLPLSLAQAKSQAAKAEQHALPASAKSTVELPPAKPTPWQYLQQNAVFDIPLNQQIAAERKSLLHSKRSLNKILHGSEPYIYYIVDQLEQRKMPVEIALVPMIESAYNPQAVSSSNAAGLWQFMPPTAQALGLKMHNDFDPRRDLVASTEAALNYLQYLNRRLKGDWLLTLAAYNSGLGRVLKAQKWNREHGLPTHFWALKLPKQTVRYVSKMLALVDIVKHSHKYGVSLPKTSVRNALTQINLGQSISLPELANLSGLSLQELQHYNAGVLKQQIKAPYHLLVPNHLAQSLCDKLLAANYPEAKVVNLISLPADPTREGKQKLVQALSFTNQRYAAITDADIKQYQSHHQAEE